MDQMTTPFKPSPSPEVPAPLFHADGAEATAFAEQHGIELLAELAVHHQTQTPLTIGLFGPPGSGKSHALRALARRAKGLAAAARAGGPFLSQVLAIQVDARKLQADPVKGLASALHDALLARGVESLSGQLGTLALEAATDPHAAAVETSRALAETREKLAQEERNLEELRTRRARLSDAILFETTNTGLDDYIRRNRKQLEGGLKTFGFSGDATAIYKDLVRDLGHRTGPLSRLKTFVTSAWAYGGQATLLVWALTFFLLGWAFSLAQSTRGDWLASLRNAAEGAKDTANWIDAHAGWLATLSQAAIALGMLCLAVNVWRAARFTLPLLKGQSLLKAEVETRRGELDRLIARQTQSADERAGEAEALARRAKATEQRTRERSAPGQTLFAAPGSASPTISAAAYLEALAEGLKAKGGPERILVSLDGLEALTPTQAAALVDAVHHSLNRPGFVLAMALDADQLTAGWGGAAQAATRLGRYVQAPFTLRAIRDPQVSIAYAHQLLGAAPEYESAPLDASHSALDRVVKPVETHLLGKLASLAGDTPRAVKRYLNIWRLARPLTEDGGALALMLALDTGATAGELAAMGAAMDLEEPDAPLIIHPGEPRLAAALASVNALRSSPLTNEQAHEAWLIARDFSIPQG